LRPMGGCTSSAKIGPQLYRLRQQRIFEYLAEKQIEVGLIVDLEGLRNRSLRYLCGLPMDALLFLFAEGRSLLVAWDVPLARSLAVADELIPFERYVRSLSTCVRSVLLDRGSKRAELSAELPYPLVEVVKGSLPGVIIECRQGGIDETINVMRMIKDSGEIEALRRACGITDELIKAVPDLLAEQPGISELELALFLEAEARRRGAEGMGFDTVVASPRRSFAIHCFPNFTAEPIAGEGLSILDFGVSFDGYTSDVTLTLARPALTARQEAMIDAVQQAYDLARSLCKPGVEPALVGERVQQYFESRGFHMPHSLGHGIGLDAHEAPLFRRTGSKEDTVNRRLLQAGMVFAMEPGLYDPENGGVRLENDFLCTGQGAEILTSARILLL
jgi:Xaa-Pro dipeptidase